MRRLLRWTIRLALLVAVISLARAILEARRPPAPPSDVPWPPIEPAIVPATQLTAPVAESTMPAEPAPSVTDDPPTTPSVDPVDGACPVTHPVKGKHKSGLFHEPGMLQYERTRPDRCYVDAKAAEADGLARAKR